MRTIIRTTCSACMKDVVVKRKDNLVSCRGRTNNLIDDDGDLVTWDCPNCGYADSFDLNFAEDKW